MTIAPALRRIEAELAALIEAADETQPVDPYALRQIARQIGAQAEMLEVGCAE
jgi:hypothetical protein